MENYQELNFDEDKLAQNKMLSFSSTIKDVRRVGGVGEVKVAISVNK